MRSRSRLLLAFCLMLLAAAWLACCGSAPGNAGERQATALPATDLQALARAEATAIIQQAQATALVLQAQAQATALLEAALVPEPSSSVPAAQVLPVLTPTPTQLPEGQPATARASNVTVSPTWTATVELLSVGFGADGAYIVANYKAPPAVAQSFWPGVLSITDEASGTVFNEVPLVPLIGPLIARPVEEGQPGYFMVVHAPAILRRGSLVTVDLADYRFEHVPVQ